MYINFNLLNSKGLVFGDVELLTAIKLKQLDFVEAHLSERNIERFRSLELLSDKNKLTDKGKKLLVDLSFEGSADEESEVLANWVISIYKNKVGGIVKNKKEVVRRLHWFKTVTQIKGNFLALLIQSAISDTYCQESGQSFSEFKQNNPRAILSNMAENLFWTPASVFDRNKTLEKSPLHIYLEDNQDYIKNLWDKNLDENGNKR
jgi:hypothetical protein